MSTTLLSQPATMRAPLTRVQRQAIMRHAPALSADGRRLFRRLLIVGQGRGLTAEAIDRAAAQARGHMADELSARRAVSYQLTADR